MGTTAYTEQVGGSGNSILWRFRSGYRQKPIDYRKVLPYTNYVAAVNNIATTNRTFAWQLGSYCGESNFRKIDSRLVDATYNKAYADLVSKLGDSASLGETFGEFGQSFAMIARRADELVSLVRALKKLDFQSAAAVVRGAVSPGFFRDKWHSDRSFASNWLEVHLGWQPLIGDMYSSMAVLTSPVEPRGIRGRARSDFKYDMAQPVLYSNPQAMAPSNAFQRSYTRIHGFLRCQQTCNVLVDNPNLYLLSRLGLANPALTAWNLVGYSFVVDWFANVSDVLASMTDFLGLAVSDSYSSISIKGVYDDFYEARYWWFEGSPPHPVWGGGIFADCNGVFSSFERQLGIVTPVLQVRPYKVPGLARAATAVSLLLQHLPRA